ncbi:MAG: lipid II flippase Amj family protein [Massilia sp.]
MDRSLLFICFLTFVIHLIGTLAYSVRIAGVRTRRIAVSFALFSILVLVSRTSNSFLGPFLAKRVESGIGAPAAAQLLGDFRWLLLAATLATIVGALLVPTFQRLFCRAVAHFQVHRSVPKLLLHAVFKGGLSHLRTDAAVPRAANVSVSAMRDGGSVSIGVTLLNVMAVALWTVGVFAALYAGVLDPAVRVTSSTLSSIINGGATVMMAVFIDPHMSGMTDDVIDGRVSESQFRRAVVWLVGSRLAGTLLAQALLVPSAALIVMVAKAI